MDTPICDFVSHYSESEPVRLHMPGHKGTPLLGMETIDITEIDGADSLFDAVGIIHKSEENAGKLFGCQTFYSTEGSSLCIRAMLYLCMLYAKKKNKKPRIVAARNVHSAFIRAAAMLDFDIHWLYGHRKDGYLSCVIDPQSLDHCLSQDNSRPIAVYLTSPDYLGNIADIRPISEICHKYGVLLIVDNAHGAYLKFLPHSMHPMDLGADLCCDSAHKTLPVLTGGAYLHISNQAPEIFLSLTRQALAMFASTSPSYLILQSLDAANKYLDEQYRQNLQTFLTSLNEIKGQLIEHGYSFIGDEPMKWTIDCKAYGYLGPHLAQHLKAQNIFVEFVDPDFVVLMFSPQTGTAGLEKLSAALKDIPLKQPITEPAPLPCVCQPILTPREAAFMPCESIPISDSLGRILAAPSVGCPPAVPIVVSGEKIDEKALTCFHYYGIQTCYVTIP